MKAIYGAVTLAALVLCSPVSARADVVLDWNQIAVSTLVSQGQSPFAQARYMAIAQLAVFEAVNAISRDYQPYLRTVVAPADASAEAAAAAAAHDVLAHYFPQAAAGLDAALSASLAAIPDGPSKSAGLAAGQAAAAQMIAVRVGDGSSPPQFYAPASTAPGQWQPTPSCPAAGGTNFQWQNIAPFAVSSAPGDHAWIAPFAPAPPPALTSTRYTKDYNESKAVGSATADADERPQDRADVARFYAASTPAFVFNLAARQVAAAESRSLAENARTLALLNMALSDSTVAAFWVKYHYVFWRPETAIHNGDVDPNPDTWGDTAWTPYILTPCFPSYPSIHGTAGNAAAEVLRRIFGEGGHSIVMANPAVPDLAFHYTRFNQITDDISDARIYGGIHFRFDQEAGADLGRDIGTYVYKNQLRPAKQSGED